MTRGVNRLIIEEFRANAGHVSGPLTGTPMLLIHHTRARFERVTPLAYQPQGDGRNVIAASNGGSPEHPRWYRDLTANPRIDVEVGSETLTVLARELEGAERQEVWSALVEAFPSVGEFQSRTARRIPIFVLTRIRE